MASMYKSTYHQCHHVQEHTLSWPALYKHTEHHGQHVQEHTASQTAHARAHSICMAAQQFYRQSMWGSFDTTSGHFWKPHNSQLWLPTSPSKVCNVYSIQNNHCHLYTDTNRHVEAHTCSTKLSNACTPLTLSLSCYNLDGFKLWNSEG
jgi:hypothetical protein